MANKQYPETLTNEEILKLSARGQYIADLESGVILTKQGHYKKPYIGGEGNALYTKLKHQGKYKTISVHRLIWMVGTGHTIPESWEVHHRDENNRNNCFTNLICLHPIDHKKLHYGPSNTKENHVPF
jgi:plasmid replication initiation protein